MPQPDFARHKLMGKVLISSFVLIIIILGISYYSLRGSRLAWRDVAEFNARPSPIGVLPGEPRDRIGLPKTDPPPVEDAGPIRYVGMTRYLNNARAVVTHTIDDSTKYIRNCLDAMDQYGIKATVFVNTQRGEIERLWPRLRQAVANGHEIGSHSRRHQCRWPDTFFFCFRAYTDYEIDGSRDDILAHIDQPHVWSWCYPCGLCAEFDFVQRKLARAGYLVARSYPGEAQDQHLVPNLQTYAANPYNAAYTQVVQKKGGIATAGRTNVAELNTKFDEVYRQGGLYHFLSHPQWLDYGAEGFYEQHLAHISRRPDIWYVPLGPLYAYRTVRESTKVSRLPSNGGALRYAVYNHLDPKIFNNSVTLEFTAPAEMPIEIVCGGRVIEERKEGLTDRWSSEYARREGNALFVTMLPNKILEIREK